MKSCSSTLPKSLTSSQCLRYHQSRWRASRRGVKRPVASALSGSYLSREQRRRGQLVKKSGKRCVWLHKWHRHRHWLLDSEVLELLIVRFSDRSLRWLSRRVPSLLQLLNRTSDACAHFCRCRKAAVRFTASLLAIQSPPPKRPFLSPPATFFCASSFLAALAMPLPAAWRARSVTQRTRHNARTHLSQRFAARSSADRTACSALQCTAACSSLTT
jgi:hypothetical protein